jgi:hypothetical protein
VDNRDFEQALKIAEPFLREPRAVQRRTVFSGVPCLKLAVNGYKSPIHTAAVQISRITGEIRGNRFTSTAKKLKITCDFNITGVSSWD